MIGHGDAHVEDAGSIGALEVLVDVTQNVGISGRGREDVHEAEELGLERRVGHRPREHALAPPRHAVDPRPLVGAELGDAPGQGGDVRVERCGHDAHGTAGAVGRAPPLAGQSVPRASRESHVGSS